MNHRPECIGSIEVPRVKHFAAQERHKFIWNIKPKLKRILLLNY